MVLQNAQILFQVDMKFYKDFTTVNFILKIA